MPKLENLKPATQKLVEYLQINISVGMYEFTEEENKQIEQDFIKFDFSDLYIDGDYYLAGLLEEVEETKGLHLYDED